LLFSPLEQFEVFPFFYGIQEALMDFTDLDITNFAISLVLSFLIFLFVLYAALSISFVVPSSLQLFLEDFYKLCCNILDQQLGERSPTHVSPLLVLFTALLIVNLQGLVPLTFTVTGTFILPFLLAFWGNIIVLLQGLAEHGLEYRRLFIPQGVPSMMLPLYCCR